MSLRANLSKRMKAGVLFLSACMFSAGATVIDFTDDTHIGLDNQSTYSAFIDELGTTMSLTSAPRGAKMTWNEGTGIGIDYTSPDEVDEIDYPEVLTISFDQSVRLENVTLSNFFDDEILWVLPEVGKYRLANSGSYTSFYAENRSGWQTIEIGQEIDMIQFTAPYAFGLFGQKLELYEFSVASLSVSSVPEPGMISMFGFGLISLIGLGFRNRKKA